MARRRGQRKGFLREKSGSWLLTWREDVRDEDGKLIRKPFTKKIAIAKGAGAVSKREAQRMAWETVLSKLDTVSLQPSSLMLVNEFVEGHFIPDVVYNLKHAGQIHYRTMFKHVLPTLGELRLRDIGIEDVQKLVRVKLEAGYSTQTVAHIRNVVSAVFRHAKRKQWYSGENPAADVRMPEMQRVRVRSALTFDQAAELLIALPSPAREMALVAMTTSMNIAELSGLRWKRINFTDEWSIVEGEPIPPKSIAVRENYYKGVFGSVKAAKRNRNIPMPKAVSEALALLRNRPSFVGPEDVVFASRNGTPADTHNIAADHLKPIGRSIGIPVLNWHTFRRTQTTLAEMIGMGADDRQAVLGHATAQMTEHYTVRSVDRVREGLERLASRLVNSDKPVTTKPC